MKVTTTTVLPASHEAVWELLKQSSTLLFVTKGWVTFDDTEHFPAKWAVDCVIHTRVRPFGLGSGTEYKIHFIEIRNGLYHRMRTKESGGPFKKWNHTMSVRPVGVNQCRYTDTVNIDAGVFTPLYWMYVTLYYRQRHKRWKLLLQQQ